jgi:hypothetical protein
MREREMRLAESRHEREREREKYRSIPNFILKMGYQDIMCKTKTQTHMDWKIINKQDMRMQIGYI